jgi:hypothetical protein
MSYAKTVPVPGGSSAAFWANVIGVKTRLAHSVASHNAVLRFFTEVLPRPISDAITLRVPAKRLWVDAGARSGYSEVGLEAPHDLEIQFCSAPRPPIGAFVLLALLLKGCFSVSVKSKAKIKQTYCQKSRYSPRIARFLGSNILRSFET